MYFCIIIKPSFDSLSDSIVLLMNVLKIYHITISYSFHTMIFRIHNFYMIVFLILFFQTNI